ncbi:hypothetical protein TRAPUB_7636 [Trametes pubescens]|uniref:Uncharacterized protein n=1 Tax=Trametes pubescens TaxID=154538 RepID=A0A1M2V2T1_TRAPU|nr:hypothetical protein TRAPUB_7636 [Trametes pubescens]
MSRRSGNAADHRLTVAQRSVKNIPDWQLVRVVPQPTVSARTLLKRPGGVDGVEEQRERLLGSCRLDRDPRKSRASLGT